MMHSASTSELATVELLHRATNDSAELIRLELALAREEIRHDLVAARRSAIFGGVAIVLALTGIASLVIALGVALGPLAALLIGFGMLAAASLFGFLAYRSFPNKPLEATSRRLHDDERLVKEHLS